MVNHCRTRDIDTWSQGSEKKAAGGRTAVSVQVDGLLGVLDESVVPGARGWKQRSFVESSSPSRSLPLSVLFFPAIFRLLHVPVSLFSQRGSSTGLLAAPVLGLKCVAYG